MSENSPRWPSASGAPDLDFSPDRRHAADAGAGPVADQLHGSPAETPPRSGSEAPAWARPSGQSPGRATDAGSTEGGDSRQGAASTTAEPAAEQTQTIPEAAARAARAAQEWAAKARTAITTTVAAAAASSPVEHHAPPGAGLLPGTAPAIRTVRRTRKARLRLSRIDPWSVMKTTFLFSIAFGVMTVVATSVVWSVLAGSGALEALNELINTLIGDQDTAVNIGDFFSMSRVLGFATVIAAIDVVILTAVATLFAFLYNLAATVMGGLEVTLAED